jgi:DNA-binding transcriptional MerR regulator
MKIQHVAEQTGLSIHALRYYEQIGLVTPIHRHENGHRVYSEDDVGRIIFVTRLRATGMPIAEIKRYTDLADLGDSTVGERLAIMEAHRAHVEQRIEELRQHLELISNKITYYRELYRDQLQMELDNPLGIPTG